MKAPLYTSYQYEQFHRLYTLAFVLFLLTAVYLFTLMAYYHEVFNFWFALLLPVAGMMKYQANKYKAESKRTALKVEHFKGQVA